jgi:hypothetical protein
MRPMTTRAGMWIAAALVACSARGGAPAAPSSPGASAGVGRSFDRGAAEVALDAAAQVAARDCPQPGQAGVKGPVKVTFAPDGAVTSSTTDAPWADTPIGGCALSAFRAARVPPFDGQPVTMTTSVDVP